MKRHLFAELADNSCKTSYGLTFLHPRSAELKFILTIKKEEIQLIQCN